MSDLPDVLTKLAEYLSKEERFILPHTEHGARPGQTDVEILLEAAEALKQPKKVYGLWVQRNEPPYSVLLGIFGDKAKAQDATADDLGEAGNYLKNEIGRVVSEWDVL